MSAVALEAGAELRRVETDYASATTVNQDPDNPYPDTAGFSPSMESASRASCMAVYSQYTAFRSSEDFFRTPGA
jgi:hypothetical protein